jgi:PAS domain S-box-containing protein
MPDETWDRRAVYFNIASREFYQNFTESVVQMAQEGTDVQKYAGPLFNSDSLGVMFYTRDGAPVSEFGGNFRTVFSFMFMKESMMHVTPDPRTWFSESEEMCMLMSLVFHLLPEALTSMRESVSAMGDDMAEDSSRMLKPLKIAFPIGLFVITAGVLQIAFCLYQREISHFGALLLSLPKQDKRECTKPIRRDRDLEIAAASGQSVSAKSANVATILNVVLMFGMAGGAAAFFACLENVDWYNTDFWDLNGWVLRATARKSLIVEGTLAALMVVLIVNNMTDNVRGPQFNYLQADRLLQSIQDRVDSIVAYNKQLLEGDDERPGATGRNEEIDRFTLEQQCETHPTDQSYHESYRCSSGLQLVHFFLTLVLKIKMDPSLWGGVVWRGELAEMIHLVEAHLLPTMIAIDRLYIGMAGRVEGEFVSSHQLYFAVCLVIEFLTLLIIVAYCWAVNSCYDVLLALMRKVSPAHILASGPLQAYLLNREALKAQEGLGADERIIQYSADGIICMGPTGLIDLINPAVTSILGYQPEQLLGQPLASLLVPAQAEKLSQQIGLMAEHQSAHLFEGHVTCCADDEQEVQCGISLVAMFNGDEPSAFVAILTNESQLIKEQTEAETLKKQSETLLFQILPRGIVVRLNAGEKDIFFSIPTATICFIDIVKFSEYASNLAPPEIMGNLSLIFTSFDEELAKYPQLIKIKLIGDVYMGAGGLFTPEAAPETHAREMIQFTVEALKIIDDVNIKLNSLLAVRIGVNTGGPILAGLLGTDKPAFDIIGDPINIAARLQSTDIPGHVQVSEDTHRLVSEMPVTIEYRGEIELKGKGKKKTFLVSPPPEASTMSVTGTTPSTLEDFARFVPEQGRT